MVKFESLFVSFALAALLVVGLFAFGITLQEDNNADEKIIDIPILNNTYGSLKSDLESNQANSQNQLDIFETEEPKTGYGSLLFFSIVSSGKTFTGVIIGTFNLLIKLPTIVFGVDPVISAVLSTIIIISFILGLWILYKLGG